tara:strand:+ start:250 stop:414 length:165 start_codon:yes stop_codon:yes gene_type:complete
VSIVELEVEIAWLERDLTNAEMQQDNDPQIQQKSKQLNKLYEELEIAKTVESKN